MPLYENLFAYNAAGWTGVNQWYETGFGVIAGPLIQSSTAIAVGTALATPIVVGGYTSVKAMGIEVVTGQSGATLHLGLYRQDRTLLDYPGYLVASVQVSGATAGAATASLSRSVPLEPGYYFTGYLATGSASNPTVRAATVGGQVIGGLAAPTDSAYTIIGFQATGLSALPAVWPSTVSVSTFSAFPLVCSQVGA